MRPCESKQDSVKIWVEDVLSVNMIQLSKKLNLVERNRMLIGSDAESNNTCFLVHRGE